MFQVRNRLITLRVTQEEFERLTTAASLQGSRSLSEFARARMLGSAHYDSVSTKGGLEGELLSLDHRLAILELSVAKLLGAQTARQLVEKS